PLFIVKFAFDRVENVPAHPQPSFAIATVGSLPLSSGGRLDTITVMPVNRVDAGEGVGMDRQSLWAEILEREVGAHEAALLATGSDPFDALGGGQIEPLVVVPIFRLPGEQAGVLDVTRRQEAKQNFAQALGVGQSIV